jgi:hypothetical protein
MVLTTIKWRWMYFDCARMDHMSDWAAGKFEPAMKIFFR